MIPLQLLTSYTDTHRSSILYVVEEAVDLGIQSIQFCWEGSDNETFTLAEKIKTLTEGKCKLIINNRLDVALAVDAEGLHLGQLDAPINMIKHLIPSKMELGLTVSSVDELKAAEHLPVDCFGIGPIFTTNTKPSNPIGLKVLSEMRQLTNKPIVAIGGITQYNSESVFDAGANGIAVIGAIYDSEHRKETIKRLIEISNKRYDQCQSCL